MAGYYYSPVKTLLGTGLYSCTRFLRQIYIFVFYRFVGDGSTWIWRWYWHGGSHSYVDQQSPQVTHSLRWLYSYALQGDRWPDNLDGCCMLPWHDHNCKQLWLNVNVIQHELVNSQPGFFYIGCTCFEGLNGFPKTAVILHFEVVIL